MKKQRTKNRNSPTAFDKEIKALEKAQKEKQLNLFIEFLEAEFGLKCTPEYKFHPTRKWRIDFYFEGRVKIALEVEGGIYTKGRHITPSGFIADMEKYNALTEQGIFLLRTVPKDWDASKFKASMDIIKLLKKLL